LAAGAGVSETGAAAGAGSTAAGAGSVAGAVFAAALVSAARADAQKASMQANEMTRRMKPPSGWNGDGDDFAMRDIVCVVTESVKKYN
jgi:hypothetical protein